MFTFFSSNSPSPRHKLYRWQGTANVETQISPKKQGRVRFRGSFWNAKSFQPISFVPGDVVEVKGIEDMTLIVESITS
jgi:membrane protein implicated in regulation of membrane protease activity